VQQKGLRTLRGEIKEVGRLRIAEWQKLQNGGRQEPAVSITLRVTESVDSLSLFENRAKMNG